MIAIERQVGDDVVTCLLPSGARVWVGIAFSIVRLEPRVHQSGLRLHQATAELNGHRGPINCMAVVDRALWSGSNDGTIRRWDTETGACLSVVVERLKTFSFLRVGKQLFSGGGDGSITVWDAQTGKRHTTLTKHTDAVASLTLVWNDTIWSASWDRSICIWV